MASVEIYTWSTCPFCIRAKALLDRKGVQYVEHCIDGDNAARAKMVERTGGPRSLPQIFADDKYVGDCSEIYELDAQGRLDPILNL